MASSSAAAAAAAAFLHGLMSTFIVQWAANNALTFHCGTARSVADFHLPACNEIDIAWAHKINGFTAVRIRKVGDKLTPPGLPL